MLMWVTSPACQHVFLSMLLGCAELLLISTASIDCVLMYGTGFFNWCLVDFMHCANSSLSFELVLCLGAGPFQVDVTVASLPGLIQHRMTCRHRSCV